MTVPLQTPLNSYLYAGSALFPFKFQIQQAADLAVTVDGLAKTNGTDYTISGIGNLTGGSITYTSPLTLGQRVTLRRSTQLARTVDYQDEGDFLAGTVNGDYDQLWRALQDLSIVNQKFIQGQPGETFPALPAPGSRGSQILGFDSAGGLQLYAPGAVNMNIVSQPQSETQTLSIGQTLVTLTTFTYPSSKANAITVFLDGQEITDFTQTSDSSITLTTAAAFAHQITVVTNTFASFGSGRTAARDAAATATDFASAQFRRDVNYSGGGVGVNGCIRADTYVNNPATATFEWAVIGVMHNNALAGENVGGYFQGNQLNTGSTWGAVAEGCDQTFTSSAGKQGLIGLEVDVYCNDADPSGNRVGIQIIAGDAKYNRGGGAGVAGVATFGLIIENQGLGSGADFVNGIVVNSATGVGVAVNTPNFVPQAFRVQNKAQVGLDTSTATIGIAAVRMATGQSIAFNAGSTRQLSHDGNGFIFNNPPGAATYWSLLDNGALKFGATQLLGAQVTGYALMTGTVNRGTVYDTSTITLQQLAQRFAAFQNDVMNVHGFIHT